MQTFLDLLGTSEADSLLSMLNKPWGMGEDDVLAGLNKPRPDYFTMSSAVKRPMTSGSLYATSTRAPVRPQVQTQQMPPTPPIATGAPQVTQRLQEPTDLSVTGFHKGVDLAIPIGTPVASIDDGVVAGVGDHPEYGKFVLVRHPWGTSMYAHGSRAQVQEGMPVGRGQPIMYSGASGKVTGPHLHLETMDNEGNLLDPVEVANMVGQQYMGLGNVTPMTPEELAAEGL